MRKPRETGFSDYIENIGEMLALENIPDSESDLEVIFQKKENERLLHSLLMTLKHDQRAIIIATEIEGRSFKELSDDWGVPIGTLLSRKNRAFNKLKQNLKI